MIGERIQKIIDYAGLNAKDFAIRIGVKTPQNHIFARIIF